MNTHSTYDVFLSHSTKDKPRVRRLAEKLRDHGLVVWFDEWVVPPSRDIYVEIESGLQASRTLVLCLSPSLLKSEWVDLERSTAIFRDPSNKERRLIPLLLRRTEMPDALARYAYIDYRHSSKAAFSQLLKAIRQEVSEISSRSSTNSRGHRQDASLLVVDDDAYFLEDVTFFLEDAGFCVIPARDVETAIDTLRKHSAEIDLVLLDLMISRGDKGSLTGYLAHNEETGIGLARWIRENHPDIAVVGMSVKNRVEAEAEWFGEHSAGYISKPISANVAELIEIVRNIRRE